MRTPSMETSEIEAILGPRGDVVCDAESRPLLRKWISASGYPSAMAANLSAQRLADIYNDRSDTLLGDAAVIWRNTGSVSAFNWSAPIIDAEYYEKPAPMPALPAPKPASNGHDPASQLATLIGQIAGNSVSPEAVAAIVDQRVTGLLTSVQGLIQKALADHPAAVLEVRSPNGAHKIEGLRHRLLPELVQAISLGFPLMIIGPAGGGKTTAAEQACEALGLTFYIQGACDSKYDLLGFVDGAGAYHTTPFRQAFEHGGVICLDEIDAGDASATLAMNAALANGHMAFPDNPTPVRRHADFRVIACANTFGLGADRIYVGRNQLDGATLDRFWTINWEYDRHLELTLAGNDEWTHKVQVLRECAERMKARVVISPRASIMGAKAIAAGLSEKVCLESLVWKGIAPDIRRQIEESAR